MSSNKSVLLLLLTVVSLAFFSCSSENNPTDGNQNTIEVPDGLVGYWVGTSFRYINKADTTVQADLSQFGVVFSVTVEPDSSYSSTTLFLGQTIEESGTISVVQNTVNFTQQADQTRSGTFSLNGTNMDIRFEEEFFDFDQDGTEEPAILDISLEKRIQ